MRLIKYKFMLIIIFFVLLLCLNIVNAKIESKTLPLFGKVITVDAGHPS